MNMSQLKDTVSPVKILLVDDDEGDVILTQKALQSGKLLCSLSVVEDGVQAMAFLKQEGEYSQAPRPDLILLDLNMPRMDGRETLSKIKDDDDLKNIPVVVLTTSEADRDVVQSYNLQASCYVTKPVDLKQFSDVVQSLKGFWLCVVRFPGPNAT
jgi:CheY-like chemotaxis protein